MFSRRQFMKKRISKRLWSHPLRERVCVKGLSKCWHWFSGYPLWSLMLLLILFWYSIMIYCVFVFFRSYVDNILPVSWICSPFDWLCFYWLWLLVFLVDSFETNRGENMHFYSWIMFKYLHVFYVVRSGELWGLFVLEKVFNLWFA